MVQLWATSWQIRSDAEIYVRLIPSSWWYYQTRYCLDFGLTDSGKKDFSGIFGWFRQLFLFWKSSRLIVCTDLSGSVPFLKFCGSFKLGMRLLGDCLCKESSFFKNICFTFFFYSFNITARDFVLNYTWNIGYVPGLDSCTTSTWWLFNIIGKLYLI